MSQSSGSKVIQENISNTQGRYGDQNQSRSRSRSSTITRENSVAKIGSKRLANLTKVDLDNSIAQRGPTNTHRDAGSIDKKRRKSECKRQQTTTPQQQFAEATNSVKEVVGYRYVRNSLAETVIHSRFEFSLILNVVDHLQSLNERANKMFKGVFCMCSMCWRLVFETNKKKRQIGKPLHIIGDLQTKQVVLYELDAVFGRKGSGRPVKAEPDRSYHFYVPSEVWIDDSRLESFNRFVKGLIHRKEIPLVRPHVFNKLMNVDVHSTSDSPLPTVVPSLDSIEDRASHKCLDMISDHFYRMNLLATQTSLVPDCWMSDNPQYPQSEVLQPEAKKSDESAVMDQQEATSNSVDLKGGHGTERACTDYMSLTEVETSLSGGSDGYSFIEKTCSKSNSVLQNEEDQRKMLSKVVEWSKESIRRKNKRVSRKEEEELNLRTKKEEQTIVKREDIKQEDSRFNHRPTKIEAEDENYAHSQVGVARPLSYFEVKGIVQASMEEYSQKLMETRNDTKTEHMVDHRRAHRQPSRRRSKSRSDSSSLERESRRSRERSAKHRGHTDSVELHTQARYMNRQRKLKVHQSNSYTALEDRPCYRDRSYYLNGPHHSERRYYGDMSTSFRRHQMQDGRYLNPRHKKTRHD